VKEVLMKNSLKRDVRGKNGVDGNIVSLSSHRLAAAGKGVPSGTRRGDPAPPASVKAAPRTQDDLQDVL